MRSLNRIEPIKEAAWVFVGQAFAFLGGLAGIKLLTNLMTVESYGELALGLSIAGIVNVFLFGPLGQVGLRFYSTCRENGETTTFTAVLVRLHSQAIILLATISLPIAPLVGIALEWKWALFFLTAIMFGVLSGVQGSLLSLFAASRDRRMAALTQGADTWLRLGCATVIVYCGGSAGILAIVGYATGSLLIVATQIWVARRRGFWSDRSPPDGARSSVLRIEFLRYALPFIAFAGLASVSLYADRWLLQTFLMAADVGIYSAIFQLASAPVALLMGVATQLIIPVVFARSGNLDDHDRTRSSQRLVSRSVLIIGAMYAALTLAAYRWGEVFITLLTNADYAKYASSLWVIVFSQALFNLAQFLVSIGLTLHKPHAYFAAKLGQAVCLLIAGLLLVRTGGVNGMAEALLVSSIVYLAWVIAVNKGLLRDYVGANSKLG